MEQNLSIIGRVGRDSEMKYTASGQAVTNFSVAVSKKWTDKEGEKRERTTWFRVSTWGKTAENCNQYVKKGMLVKCDGELIGDEGGNPRTYTKQDGTAGASFELNAHNVLFLSRVESADSGNSETERVLRDEAVMPAEDDIPF